MSTVIIPLVAYLALTFALALWAQRQSKHGSGVFEEYFLGSRSMGGFVLAMTIIASYTSASSFVGGPGVAYRLGLGWVLLAMIQVPTTFLTLGVLGKRFATLGRRLHAVTITDFLYARYRSDGVVVLCSLAVLLFFAASMLAQFIGGGRVFQAVTGCPYEVGLFIFGFSVVLYTTVGGFRAVVLTDALQGVVMLGASVVVFAAAVYSCGGMSSAMQSLKAIDPMLLSPSGAGGSIPAPFLLSFWVLVGFGVLGLPQTTQRCFGYRDSASMHSAMVMGTLIIGFLLLFMHLSGVLGRVILPELEAGDLVIPTLILKILPPFWAGVFLAGPLAAIMSTVDTMLLLLSASIIKDLYVRYWLKNDVARMPEKRIGRMTFFCTLAVGTLVFLAAFNPPDLLVWINLFAFGGLEAVFLWPVVLGMYWQKANAAGAICSILCGTGVFVALTVGKLSPMGMHPIVPSLALSLLAFALGARLGKPVPTDVIAIFWQGKPHADFCRTL